MMLEFSLPPSSMVALTASVVLPLIVGLVTTHVTAPKIKGLLLTGLSVATGVLSELGAAMTDGTPYDLGVGIVNAILALGVAQGAYGALWKPTGVASKMQSVGIHAATGQDVP